MPKQTQKATTPRSRKQNARGHICMPLTLLMLFGCGALNLGDALSSTPIVRFAYLY